MSIIWRIIGRKKRNSRKHNRKILEHNRLKPRKVHIPVSFVFTYACPVTQHYRQRRALKASLLATV